MLRLLWGLLVWLSVQQAVWAQEHACHVQAPHSHAVQLHVAVMQGQAIAEPAKRHARSFQEQTGIEVIVHEIPFKELFEQSLEGLREEPARYDVLFFAPAWMGDLAPHLRAMPFSYQRRADFEDIHPAFRSRLMKWGRQTLAITCDGDHYLGYYRKDLFAHPQHRAAFYQIFGYPLAPPTTWAMYADIARYFTEYGQGTFFGTSEPFADGDQRFWHVCARAASYAYVEGEATLPFFDKDTMHALIATPAWQKALQDYQDILPYCPKEARTFDRVAARQAFLQGHTAMTLDWGDTAKLANAEGCPIQEQIGYFDLPGSEQGWDLRRQQWVSYAQPLRVSSLVFGGWVGGVAANSPHSDLAWDYLFWVTKPEHSLKDAIQAGTGIDPYRYSHFESIQQWLQVFPPEQAFEYLRVVQLALDSPRLVHDLRIRGHHRYMEAFEIGIDRILDGAPIEETLHERAQAWDAITQSLGTKKQQKIYRYSMVQQ